MGGTVMKTYFGIIAATLLVTLAGCASTSPQSGFVDDVYYNPKKHQSSNQIAQYNTPPKLSKEQEEAYKQGYAKAVAEIEKQNINTNNHETDFNAIQSQYAQVLADDSLQEVDTVLYYNDETGYWVNGFNGSDMDKDYAERLIRFYGPFNGVPYGSALYSDMAYVYNPDWNIYVDGNYMYAIPTWSNPYYTTYQTSPSWSINFGMGWGYGHYNPWYGWGYPYYSWGYPYYGYGYGYPHYGYGCGYPYYGCGYPPYYYGGGGGGYYPSPRTYGPRNSHASGRSQNGPIKFIAQHDAKPRPHHAFGQHHKHLAQTVPDVRPRVPVNQQEQRNRIAHRSREVQPMAIAAPLNRETPVGAIRQPITKHNRTARRHTTGRLPLHKQE
jgi:hypothetical protein